MTRAGIVGVGVVGGAMQRLLPDAVGYDVKVHPESQREAINACDIVFVCVPTPMAEDGSCDTSIVEETIGWLKAPLIVIRSTIPPGTTDRLKAATGKRIVFQPEYLGETPGHPMWNLKGREFIVLGGAQRDASAVADFYKHYYHSDLRFYFCDVRTAELAKYMENAFYAVKVTFCNEFFDLAKTLDVDFNELREVWLADPRISRDHTFVYPDQRGFSGKCLPKDVSAIIHCVRENGCEPDLLCATMKINNKFLALNKDAATAAPARDNAARPAPDASEVGQRVPSPRRRIVGSALPKPAASGYRDG
jgi:UDPglucose 6-dehydrogenase